MVRNLQNRLWAPRGIFWTMHHCPRQATFSLLLNFRTNSRLGSSPTPPCVLSFLESIPITLLFHQYQLIMMQNQWEPWASFPATRQSHLGLIGDNDPRSLFLSLIYFVVLFCLLSLRNYYRQVTFSILLNFRTLSRMMHNSDIRPKIYHIVEGNIYTSKDPFWGLVYNHY